MQSQCAVRVCGMVCVECSGLVWFSQHTEGKPGTAKPPPDQERDGNVVLQLYTHLRMRNNQPMMPDARSYTVHGGIYRDPATRPQSG